VYEGMRKKDFKFLYCLLLTIVLNMSAAGLAEANSGADGPTPVTEFMIFEDVDGSCDFSVVSSPAFTASFHPYAQDTLSLGVSHSVFWVRFILPVFPYAETGAREFLQLANPNISWLDVYFPVYGADDTQGAIHYVEKNGGAARRPLNHEVWDTSWAFIVPGSYARGQYVFLRLQSISSLRLPVLVWQEKAFFQSVLVKNFIYGIFYGILAAMLLYNLFIVFVLRDKTYLFYILYIFFMLVYQLDAHGHLKLWLELPYALYNSLFWLCLAAAFVFSILFTASFLQIHKGEIRDSIVIQGLLTVAVIQGLLGIAGYAIWANNIARGLGIIEPLVFIALAVSRLRRGFRPAIFYLLAWGILSWGILVWILSPNRVFAENILMLSTAAEMVLLSLALSDRFRTLRLKELMLTRNVVYYRDLSLTDELTGLYNRRYMKKRVQQEIRQALKEKQELSLLVMDIDFFKGYNDTYGHWQGDQVLRRFSKGVLEILQGRQLAFRFGGEEFVILLPDANLKEAATVAERIRQTFEAEAFVPAGGTLVHVTVSGGLTCLQTGDTETKLFQRADKALYQAKASGRNRIVCQ
jgi:two-component system, sensor histidine kinase LadS